MKVSKDGRGKKCGRAQSGLSPSPADAEGGRAGVPSKPPALFPPAGACRAVMPATTLQRTTAAAGRHHRSRGEETAERLGGGAGGVGITPRD